MLSLDHFIIVKKSNKATTKNPLSGNKKLYFVWKQAAPRQWKKAFFHCTRFGRIWKSQLLSIWIYFLYCNIKSTITIIPIIINLIDAEWPIVLSLRNEHNKPITIQHRAWDTFCLFILILFCGSITSSAKLLLKY